MKQFVPPNLSYFCRNMARALCLHVKDIFSTKEASNRTNKKKGWFVHLDCEKDEELEFYSVSETGSCFLSLIFERCIDGQFELTTLALSDHPCR